MQDPERLVVGGVRQYGRFATRPRTVNPLDEFSGWRRALRWPRLKEWVGFTLIHPDWFSSLIIQDAHYLASSEIYAYDRRRRTLHQHASNGRGGSVGLPTDLLGSRCAFRGRGYELAYDFSGQRARRGGGVGRVDTRSLRAARRHPVRTAVNRPSRTLARRFRRREA